MNIFQTERLNLRWLLLDDAEFILELLNEPSFIQNIGDKGVRTIADARQYLLDGPIASYEQFGFGLFMVELKNSGTPIGICGLLKREALADVDVGFAFLPRYWSKGYATEAAAASLVYGFGELALQRIVAITAPSNAGSIKVLEKTGLTFERMVQMPGEGSPIRLYGLDATGHDRR